MAAVRLMKDWCFFARLLISLLTRSLRRPGKRTSAPSTAATIWQTSERRHIMQPRLIAPYTHTHTHSAPQWIASNRWLCQQVPQLPKPLFSLLLSLSVLVLFLPLSLSSYLHPFFLFPSDYDNVSNFLMLQGRLAEKNISESIFYISMSLTEI